MSEQLSLTLDYGRCDTVSSSPYCLGTSLYMTGSNLCLSEAYIQLSSSLSRWIPRPIPSLSKTKGRNGSLQHIPNASVTDKEIPATL
jgi:hypothetical protein